MVACLNHYKNTIFKKDLFSNSTVTYKKIKNINVEKILKKFIFFDNKNIKIFIPKNNTATNSLNFLISVNNKKYYLKKESQKKEKLIDKSKRCNELQKKDNKDYFILPKNNKFIKCKNDIWSLYKYFDGELFCGKKSELKNAAKFISKTSMLIQSINIKKKSFKYFSTKESEIVSNYFKNPKICELILNHNKNKIKKNFLNYFFDEWKRLSVNKEKLKVLNKTFCHFDLHPHNIMVKKNDIKIIDLASIKYMPLEISIAYSGVKLCRQTIFRKNKKEKFQKIGSIFTDALSKSLKKKLNKKFTISDLASIEIMRRICIILKFNYNGNKSLNHVLPTLMSNLIEAKIIFKNEKF